MGNTVSKDGDREKTAAANRAAMPEFSIAARARADETTRTATREAAAAENRRRYPEFAAWVDDMRRVFGAELVRVKWPDGREWRVRRG